MLNRNHEDDDSMYDDKFAETRWRKPQCMAIKTLFSRFHHRLFSRIRHRIIFMCSHFHLRSFASRSFAFHTTCAYITSLLDKRWTNERPSSWLSVVWYICTLKYILWIMYPQKKAIVTVVNIIVYMYMLQ